MDVLLLSNLYNLQPFIIILFHRSLETLFLLKKEQINEMSHFISQIKYLKSRKKSFPDPLSNWT